MAVNRSLFRNSLVVSGLVSKQQLDALLASMAAALPAGAGGAPAPAAVVEVRDEALADRLVADGALSRYQADQLLHGRTKFNLGSYVITDFIGRGGMGDVFKAEHNLMGRQVAVKVLPRPRSTPEAEANFQREIRLQAKLDHPNLVRAYDAGHDGNVYYLVVEYVPGTDLRRLVRTQGKLDMQQAATVIMQAALGLAHAHEQGMIHRDVKPGNLLVTPEGHTKVSDLGLAGFMHEGQDDPRAGKIVGTVDYISPEVYRSPANVSPLADLYSLGCTLYYAVTGKVPYPGGSTREKLERHCHDTPYHPQRFNEDISEEFVEVIADMMEKNPQERVQSAAEVADRLSVWARGEGPLPSRMRSAWTPPPLPTGVEDRHDDSDVQLRDGESLRSLQPTRSAAAQETYVGPAESLAPAPPASGSAVGLNIGAWQWALLAAALAFPLGMCLGAVVMYALLRMLAPS
ncbi:MAG: serine/threonine protein kinase [Planctomycetales bacterium]|nr:serine/threonine protein kinase [Planctomycetales bacterium]